MLQTAEGFSMRLSKVMFPLLMALEVIKCLFKDAQVCC